MKTFTEYKILNENYSEIHVWKNGKVLSRKLEYVKDISEKLYSKIKSKISFLKLRMLLHGGCNKTALNIYPNEYQQPYIVSTNTYGKSIWSEFEVDGYKVSIELYKIGKECKISVYFK